MIIRAAIANDCETLAEIDAQDNPSPWKASQFQAALDNRLDSIYVCEQQKTICGFIVWQTVCDESELHLIVTAPKYRKQGIASLLLKAWFQAAKNHNVTHLFLEVRASNQAAQNLYYKHGFHENGRRKNYYPLPNGGTEDAVLMEKMLVADTIFE